MPVGEPKKRRRVQNLAAERRQKRKERTRGNRGSRKKLAAAYMKVSRRAKVAWRKKRDFFRNVQTHLNCGARKELVVAGSKMNRREGVARRKGNIVRNKWTRAKTERGIQKVWTRH
jgi:hypothetical protein